jgi:fatty acid-binding protein DegV
MVDFVTERIHDKPVRIAFIHAADPDGVIELEKRVAGRVNAVESMTAEMGLPVAINLGPGALGLVAIPV